MIIYKVGVVLSLTQAIVQSNQEVQLPVIVRLSVALRPCVLLVFLIHVEHCFCEVIIATLFLCPGVMMYMEVALVSVIMMMLCLFLLLTILLMLQQWRNCCFGGGL